MLLKLKDNMTLLEFSQKNYVSLTSLLDKLCFVAVYIDTSKTKTI